MLYCFLKTNVLSKGQERSSTHSTNFPLNHRFILVNWQDEALPFQQLKCNQQILTGRHKYAIQSTFSYFSVTLLLTKWKSIILWLFMLKNATSSCTLFLCFITLIFLNHMHLLICISNAMYLIIPMLSNNLQVFLVKDSCFKEKYQMQNIYMDPYIFWLTEIKHVMNSMLPKIYKKNWI